MTNALVISSTEVAALLRYRCRESFSRKRRALEAAGFPKKLPGLNGWSKPAIVRWLENNGQQLASNDDTPAADRAKGPTRLERLFG